MSTLGKQKARSLFAQLAYFHMNTKVMKKMSDEKCESGVKVKSELQ